MLPPHSNKRETKTKSKAKAKPKAMADAEADPAQEAMPKTKKQTTRARDRMNALITRDRKRDARLLARRRVNFKKRKAFVAKHFRVRRKDVRKEKESVGAQNPTLYDNLIRVVVNVLGGRGFTQQA